MVRVVKTVDENRLKGNPLAVVDITKTPITQQRKQQIAREINYSETVFLKHGVRGHNPRVEIFTPVNEMEFAGHPVIGTGHVLFQSLLGPSGVEGQCLTLETKAGPMTVEYDSDEKVVSAAVPSNVHVHSQEAPSSALQSVQSALANATGLKTTYPTVSIVKGVTYVLVDFTDAPELFAKLAPGPNPTVDLDEGWGPSFVGTMYYRVLQSRTEGDVHVWDLRVRMIAIDLEDPACGSGGCALGAFLSLRQNGNRKHRFNIDQGSEIGRDSRILVDIGLNEVGDRVSSVQLAGPAALVAQGQIFLD